MREPIFEDTTLAALEALLYHVEWMEKASGWTVGEPVKARARAAIARAESGNTILLTALEEIAALAPSSSVYGREQDIARAAIAKEKEHEALERTADLD